MEYTKLEVWRLSRKLTGAIYEMTAGFPKSENSGLADRMRTAAATVPSEIAEGCRGRTDKATVRFLYFARGSLFEIETQCLLALDKKYIQEDSLKHIFELSYRCKKLLNGFISNYKKESRQNGCVKRPATKKQRP